MIAPELPTFQITNDGTDVVVSFAPTQFVDADAFKTEWSGFFQRACKPFLYERATERTFARLEGELRAALFDMKVRDLLRYDHLRCRWTTQSDRVEGEARFV